VAQSAPHCPNCLCGEKRAGAVPIVTKIVKYPGERKARVRATENAFNAMGKPIPFSRRQAAYDCAKGMGVESGDCFTMVGAMSEQLERDKPYEAQQTALKYVDLTGAYRLMAVLLTPPSNP
jgi:hypothetical protein